MVSALTLNSNAWPSRGTSLIRNRTPPEDRHRAPDINLLQVARVGRFLMSEVPLYSLRGGARRAASHIRRRTPLRSDPREVRGRGGVLFFGAVYHRLEVAV